MKKLLATTALVVGIGFSAQASDPNDTLAQITEIVAAHYIEANEALQEEVDSIPDQIAEATEALETEIADLQYELLNGFTPVTIPFFGNEIEVTSQLHLLLLITTINEELEEAQNSAAFYEEQLNVVSEGYAELETQYVNAQNIIDALVAELDNINEVYECCLLYTSPSPRDS